MTEPLKWTREKPDIAGFYWMQSEGGDAFVAYVQKVKPSGTWVYRDGCGIGLIEPWDGFFYGPLTAPERGK